MDILTQHVIRFYSATGTTEQPELSIHSWCTCLPGPESIRGDPRPSQADVILICRGLIQIRRQHHFNIWCKVALEQLWAVIQFLFVSLPRALESPLLVNKEVFFQTKLPVQHENKMSTVLLLSQKSLFLFSILLLEIWVVFTQLFNIGIWKGLMWQCNHNALQISMYSQLVFLNFSDWGFTS